MVATSQPARIMTQGPGATVSVGRALAALVCVGDVVLLAGDLGAGKTQLTKGLAVGLGVEEPVTSPTFNILLLHAGRVPLYHFDLYRLLDAAQLEDIDYWGTLEADGVSVVEWGDRFPEAIPDECLTIRIAITDEERELSAETRGARPSELWGQLVAAAATLPGVVVIDAVTSGHAGDEAVDR